MWVVLKVNDQVVAHTCPSNHQLFAPNINQTDNKNKKKIKKITFSLSKINIRCLFQNQVVGRI